MKLHKTQQYIYIGYVKAHHTNINNTYAYIEAQNSTIRICILKHKTQNSTRKYSQYTNTLQKITQLKHHKPTGSRSLMTT